MAAAQQQQQQQQAADQQLAVQAAAVLATAGTVAEATAILAPVFARKGITKAALSAALGVVMMLPPDRQGFYGPATAQIARLNLVRRAQFLVHSSRRLMADFGRVRAGQRKGRSMIAAWQRERRYYGLHQEAIWSRMQAAAKVDTAVGDFGLLLGWYTWLDSRTSAECKAADRHNFRADQMPAIGYPGAVHLHCRCLPGPPIPGAPMVGEPARPHPARVREPAYA